MDRENSQNAAGTVKLLSMVRKSSQNAAGTVKILSMDRKISSPELGYQPRIMQLKTIILFVFIHAAIYA